MEWKSSPCTHPRFKFFWFPSLHIHGLSERLNYAAAVDRKAFVDLALNVKYTVLKLEKKKESYDSIEVHLVDPRTEDTLTTFLPSRAGRIMSTTVVYMLNVKCGQPGNPMSITLTEYIEIRGKTKTQHDLW